MPETAAKSWLDRLHGRLAEGYRELWDQAVDPLEPYLDSGGPAWQPLGWGFPEGGPRTAVTFGEGQLAEIRASCRRLATTNEFAINGHENRVSYIVGSGHSYRVTERKGRAAPAELLARTQYLIEEFLDQNDWQRRQAELVRRRDRDGEVFLRFFTGARGEVRVRFVEPDQVATPADRAGDPSASLGVLCDRDDVESVRGYFIDGQLVDAALVQHRKAHVDGNVKRGLPLFYPVRKNLLRAEKLLRNMSVVAEIQSAIALIRRHTGSTAAGVRQFAAATADHVATSGATGRTTSYRRYDPGTILDAPSGVEYDFPAQSIDASSFVIVLQAELRAIASRLVMPEFMLTSDASNANYASTMVAEGPAMRMFVRLQAEQVADDLAVLRFALRAAVEAGRLPEDALLQLRVLAEPPSLLVRDLLQETQALRIEHDAGILSPQSWSQRRGLDYDQEQHQILAHRRGESGSKTA